MTELQKELFLYRDEEYAKFANKICPNLEAEAFIGVRVPKLREIAKAFKKTEECKKFLRSLPHKYYEENLLHSILLANLKGFEECSELVEMFLPYVDNWAVCDTLRPNSFKKNTEKLLPLIKKWIVSDREYTCRFSIDMLMTYYLDENYKKEYLEEVAKVDREEYYVKMMVAWYFATALAKQWEDTIPYIENKKLPEWVHNKTIQKAIESFRITEEQKNYLKTLKIK